VFIVSLVLLGVGYALSQWPLFQSGADAPPPNLDTRPIQLASLVLLIACIALPLLGKREEASAK
jgi:hypothetical protein